MIFEKNGCKMRFPYYLFFIFGGLFTILCCLKYFDWSIGVVKQLIFLFTVTSGLFVCYFFILRLSLRDKRKVLPIIGILVLALTELSSFAYLSVNLNRVLLKKEVLTQKQGYNDYTTEAITYINDTDATAYRVDKTYDSIFLNDPVMQGYAGVKGYNSLNHPSYIDFLKTLEVPFKRRDHLNYLTGLDSRRELYALLSVKYILDKENVISDESNLIYKTGDVSIWENNYYLPFGFTYDTVIDYEDFVKFPSYEKDVILMNSFVMNKEQEEFSYFNKVNYKGLSNKTINLFEKVSKIANAKQVNSNNSEGISLKVENTDPQIVVTMDKMLSPRTSSIILSIDSPSDTELQIFWAEQLQFKEINSKKLNIKRGEGTYKVDLGNISFDSLRIDPTNEKKDVVLKKAELSYIEYDIDEFIEQSKKLSEEVLQVDKFTNDSIRGSIHVTKEKMLFLSIPYDEGWKAKVNGINVPIRKINIGFLGIPLEAGYYTIELTYDPPLFKIGLYTSMITLILLLMYFFYSRMKKML